MPSLSCNKLSTLFHVGFKFFLFVFLTAFTSYVFASGAFIPLESAAVLGDGRAGEAAVARDASTSYYNPAGLLYIKRKQLVFSADYANAHQRFTGSITIPNAYPTGTFYTQGGSVSTNPQGPIPSFHLAIPYSEKWAFGFSFTVPYGLGVDFNNNSLVRYQVIRAAQSSVNLSPVVAYKFNDHFFVGLGPDLLYYNVYEKSAIRTEFLSTGDSVAVVRASSINLGWHGGILYDFNKKTRIGLAYHSQFITKNDGQMSLYASGLVIPGLPSNGLLARSKKFQVDIPLSSLTVLSVYHELTPGWAVLGTVEYAGWSIWRNDRAYNTPTLTGGTSNSVTRRGLRNTWYGALGTQLYLSDKVLVRTGIDYMEGSTNRMTRDIFLADPSGWGIGIGARYFINKDVSLDFGYGHGFYKKAPVYNFNAATNQLINGKSVAQGDSAGVQLNYFLS